jgi:hypothetical protein
MGADLMGMLCQLIAKILEEVESLLTSLTLQQMELKLGLQNLIELSVQVLFPEFSVVNLLAVHITPR